MPEHPQELLEQGNRARREHRLDDAFHAYQQAATLARAQEAGPLTVLALSGLGQVERDRGHLEAAQGHYAEALAACRESGDPLTVAHIARHLGDVFRENGQLTQAEPLLAEAVALYRQNLGTRILDLANALRPLALLKTAQGAQEEAGRLWEETRVLYSAIHVAAGVAECSAQLEKLGRT